MSSQDSGQGNNGSAGAKGIFYHPSSLAEDVDLAELDAKLDERARFEEQSNGGYLLPQLPAPAAAQPPAGAPRQAIAPPVAAQMPPAPGPAVSTLPIGGQPPPRRMVAARAAPPHAAVPMGPTYSPEHTQAIGSWREHEQAHMLGISTVIVATSTVIGTRFGGLYGAVAGSLFGGSALNALRAIKFAMEGTPEGDKEALVSGTYTVVAASLGGYLTYMGYKARRAKP